MQYLGGKSRISKQIASEIRALRNHGQLYIEPFIGGCSVFCEIPGPKEGYDNHEDLIMMWKAVQLGWTPPEEITFDQYYSIKNGPPSALRGFVGFGCSFGGKWFGGYARQPSTGFNFARGAKNSIDKKRYGLVGCLIDRRDYRDLNPISSIVYCDPPYRGVTGYNSSFDSNEFWEVMRRWRNQGNTVIISEYSAPPDFQCVTEMRPYKSMRSSVTEKLWI